MTILLLTHQLAGTLSGVSLPRLVATSPLRDAALTLDYFDEHRDLLLGSYPIVYYWFHFALVDSAARAFATKGSMSLKPVYHTLRPKKKGKGQARADCPVSFQLSPLLKTMCSSQAPGLNASQWRDQLSTRAVTSDDYDRSFLVTDFDERLVQTPSFPSFPLLTYDENLPISLHLLLPKYRLNTLLR